MQGEDKETVMEADGNGWHANISSLVGLAFGDKEICE